MELDNTSTLVAGLGSYIKDIREAEKNQVQQELLKFVRWCGYDRTFSTLTPPEVGKYAEMLGASRTTPDATRRLEIIREFLTFANKRGLVQQNLAPHARIRKSKARKQSRAGAGVQDEVWLTPEGYEELKQRLELLSGEQVRIAEDIRKAAADKDVRENAPLEAAREQQGQFQSRIREIEKTLSVATVISGKPAKGNKMVSVGSVVELQDLGTGRKIKYRLVNSTEASPLDGKLSSASPVGKALMNQRPGKEVKVDTPGGIQRYLVLNITS